MVRLKFQREVVEKDGKRMIAVIGYLVAALSGNSENYRLIPLGRLHISDAKNNRSECLHNYVCKL